MQTSDLVDTGDARRRDALLIHRARFFNASTAAPTGDIASSPPCFATDESITTLFAFAGKIVSVGPVATVLDAAAAALLPATTVSITTVEELMAAVSAVQAASEAPPLQRRLTVIDGAGELFVTPGLVDAHVHLLDAGRRASGQFLDLRHVSSRDEFRAVVRAALAGGGAVPPLAPGEWILGGDWDDAKLGGVNPDRTWIDDLTPENPLLLTRFDVHSAVINTAALAAAGVDPIAGEEVVGGVMERFAADHPTHAGQVSGVVREAALSRIKQAFPRAVPDANMATALAAAAAELHRFGITGVHTMSSLDYANTAEIDFLDRLARVGKLPLRVACAVRYNELEWAAARNQRGGEAAAAESDWVRVLGVKVFLDGSLGSRTACFLEPFADRGGDGVLMVPDAELAAILRDVDAAGLMLMAHAIGDGTVRRLLHVFERYLFEDEPATACRANRGPPIRLRVEHCQHVSDADVARIRSIHDRSRGSARVVASMQPTHADTDCFCVADALGADRAKGTGYRFGSLRDAGGAVLAFGSDWMVMPPRPMATMIAATSPPAPFSRAEAIAAADVLHAFTTGAAFAAGWGERFGAIAPGYMADLTVLRRDVTDAQSARADADESLVAYTIIDGRIVFES